MPGIQKTKKIFLIIIALQLFLSYVNLAYAADPNDYTAGGTNPVSSQIKAYLCAPTDAGSNPAVVDIYGSTNTAAANNPAAADFYNCINKVYRFAITFGAAVGVGFIVVAGYVYMSAEGNQESVDKAKSIFASSITAMVILFAGYILLRAINPDLLQFHNIQPPSVVAPDLTLGGGGGGGGGGGTPTGGTCSPTADNACGTNKLNACTWNATVASTICNFESAGGNPSSESDSDRCNDGNPGNSWSIGLFQINIIAHGGQSYMPPQCPAGIFQIFTSDPKKNPQGDCLQRNSTGKACIKYNCKVVKPAEYAACKTALKDPTINANIGCDLYKRAKGWSPWQNTFDRCIK